LRERKKESVKIERQGTRPTRGQEIPGERGRERKKERVGEIGLESGRGRKRGYLWQGWQLANEK
jgi:hypothetical protein